MINQVKFVPNKRKYLFIADPLGMTFLNPIIDQVKDNNISFELVKLGDKTEKDIPQWLSEQKMGTYVYVSLPWEKLDSFKQLIEKVGFSEAEYQSIGYGEQKINVYCCRCHGNTEVTSTEAEIACQHCHLQLEISMHYSRLLNAYLGYVATL
jgi:dimethylamine monooxygenase subunit C